MERRAQNLFKILLHNAFTCLFILIAQTFEYLLDIPGTVLGARVISIRKGTNLCPYGVYSLAGWGGVWGYTK